MKKVFFLLVLLCCGITRAGSDHLNRANAFFRNTEYNNALEQLRFVLQSPSSQPTELVRAYRLVGLCYAALGKSAEAEDAFLRLLSLNPSYRLSESVSPKLRPPFLNAVVKSSRTGALEVKSPRVSKLSPGKWKVQLSLSSDPLHMVRAIRLVYRLKGKPEKRLLLPAAIGDTVSFMIPPEKAQGRVSYRFEVLNMHGGVLKTIDKDGKSFFLFLRLY